MSRTRSSSAEIVELHAARTLANIRQSVGLTASMDVADAHALAAAVASQIAQLPPGACNLFRRQVALATHELEALLDVLQGELDALAAELRTVNSHTSAATAYTRMARTAGHPS